MSLVHIFVSLKITDNTARSALYALQDRMGLSCIKQLKRWEMWELEFVDTPESEAAACAQDWVENTSIFMNPNKHQYKLLPSPVSILNAEFVPKFGNSDGSIFVYDREDGESESVLQSLQAKRNTSPSLQGLLRGTLWDIEFNEPFNDRSNALESVAVSTNRTSGIFANPHYQECKTFLHT